MRAIQVTGNLGQDPELRYTHSGTAVASVNIAVRRERKDNDGNYPTDWWRLTVWGKNAENFANLVHKGSRIGITGRPEIDTYDKDGVTHQVPQIQVDNFDLLDTRAESQTQQQNKPAQQTAHSNDPFQDNGKPIDITDSDLPF